MFNPLLDRLPDNYNGWLIRSDFRIGVQIQLCIADPELSDSDKTAVALSLLFGRGMPDFQTAVEGLHWFLACGNPLPAEKSQEPALYSFETDAARIVSAFQKVFHRDISRERIHWFEFVPMLADLSGTAFSSVIDIRSTSPDEVSDKKRAEFLRMKRRFALADQFSQEELDVINDVLRRVKQ
ncbi:MAG: bacteriophage Gp15 family protein [Oscillospiraceae bacterium]|nr:bacteriophage Gp15 family protein [Oscillospiraceae bacterium]